MPLADHFHSPWREQNPWEGFHSAWINTMVRHLNGTILPRRYRAVPQVHLGTTVQADLATFENNGNGFSPEGSSNDGGTAVWAPPEPVQTLVVDFPTQDVFEVRVHDDEAGRRLVGVVELVSPSNKDWPDHRQAFVGKCAALLREQVGLLIVDVVTERHANLHRELFEWLGQSATTEQGDLYAVSYRASPNQDRWRLDTWPAELTLGATLPTWPLWLSQTLAVPVDLEGSYQETCRVLRIG